MKRVKGGAAITAKKKGKPRGRPFTGKDDTRNWRQGCKSKDQLRAGVTFNKILGDVGQEKITGTDEQGRPVKATKLEMLARVYWGKALSGDIAAGNVILDRLFGKAVQPISGGLDLNVALSMDTLLKSYKEYESAGD